LKLDTQRDLPNKIWQIADTNKFVS